MEGSKVTQKTEAQFFYIDDFFYWLGCKFVTCDKPSVHKVEAAVKAPLIKV